MNEELGKRLDKWNFSDNLVRSVLCGIFIFFCLQAFGQGGISLNLVQSALQQVGELTILNLILKALGFYRILERETEKKVRKLFFCTFLLSLLWINLFVLMVGYCVADHYVLGSCHYGKVIIMAGIQLVLALLSVYFYFREPYPSDS